MKSKARFVVATGSNARIVAKKASNMLTLFPIRMAVTTYWRICFSVL
jgi:hypothetical protein